MKIIVYNKKKRIDGNELDGIAIKTIKNAAQIG